eukprot:3041135-Pyramimonas_sp.AAC.1
MGEAPPARNRPQQKQPRSTSGEGRGWEGPRRPAKRGIKKRSPDIRSDDFFCFKMRPHGPLDPIMAPASRSLQGACQTGWS